MDEMTLTLHNPLTEEEWDLIEDVDFDHTNSITFHTKHGKEVVFAKRKTGRWIERDDGWGGMYYECSVCQEAFTLIDGTPSDNLYNFCPYCGADMRGEEEE